MIFFKKKQLKDVNYKGFPSQITFRILISNKYHWRIKFKVPLLKNLNIQNNNKIYFKFKQKLKESL